MTRRKKARAPRVIVKVLRLTRDGHFWNHRGEAGVCVAAARHYGATSRAAVGDVCFARVSLSKFRGHKHTLGTGFYQVSVDGGESRTVVGTFRPALVRALGEGAETHKVYFSITERPADRRKRRRSRRARRAA